jgi:hypothetical protein
MNSLRSSFKLNFMDTGRESKSLEINSSISYVFLRQQCMKSMQTKIESNSDFSTIIKGNTIKLLKVIKQYALNYHENCYEISIIIKQYH